MEQRYIKGVLVDAEFDEGIQYLIGEVLNRRIVWGEDPAEDICPGFMKRLAKAGIVQEVSRNLENATYRMKPGIGEEFMALVAFYLEGKDEPR